MNKYRSFACIIIVVVLVLYGGMSASGQGTAPGRGQATGRIAIPPEAKRVADFLRSMGRKATADRFERDIRTGHARFGAITGRGSEGTSAEIDQLPDGSNRVTFQADKFNSEVNPKAGDKNPLLIGWALTLEHEYIHMDQQVPQQRPRWENPAYSHSLNMAQSWIEKVRSEMTEVLLMPDSPAKAARLRELADVMGGLNSATSDYVIGIKENIQSGIVSRGLDWPSVQLGTSKDLDEITRLTNELTTRYANQARADADITERRARTNEEEKKIAKEREAQEKKAREQIAEEKKKQEQKEQREKNQQEKEVAEKERAEKEQQEKEKQKQNIANASKNNDGTTTITKGQVKDSKGSITVTETYDKNGNLINVTHTEKDKEEKVTGETTYEGGQGEGKPTPSGNVDKISDLRGSEAKTSKIDKEKLEKSPEGQKAGMELAQNTKVTDSYDKDRSRKSKQKAKEVQDTTGSTQKERGDASQAEDQRDKTKIKGQGEQTDRAISTSQQEHISAEKAAEQVRQTGIGTVIAGGLFGGLSSGVAIGLDNLFGTIGKGAGQQVSSNMGIQPKPSSTGAGNQATGGTTSAAGDPLPWTYSGTCNGTVKAKANFGAGGSVSCSFSGPSKTTLNADGSVTGESSAGFWVEFSDSGSGTGCASKSGNSTFNGSHSNGSVNITSSSGSKSSGSYNANSLTYSGGRSGSSLSLNRGGSATADVSTSCTYSRQSSGSNTGNPNK